MRFQLPKLFKKFSIFNFPFSISKGFIQHQLRRSGAGFTLIELLVVIAVLGVLAAIVLLAVNPGEQLARARDTNRVSAVTQIGRSLQSYYTSQKGVYPPADGTDADTTPDWLTALQNSQDLKTIPTNPTDSGTVNYKNCIVGDQNGWCYFTGTDGASQEAVVYSGLEATLNRSKCPAGQFAWWIFSTKDGRGGVFCNDGLSEPTVPFAGPFVD